MAVDRYGYPKERAADMLPLTQRLLRLGTLLVIPGFAAGYYGALRMREFFQALPTLKEITTHKLMIDLVVPHTLFLFGFGCSVFGLLLLIKATVFHRENR